MPLLRQFSELEKENRYRKERKKKKESYLNLIRLIAFGLVFVCRNFDLRLVICISE